MKKQYQTILKKSSILYIVVMSLLVISCHSYNGAPAGPQKLTFSTYAYGQGTDPYSGALVLTILPDPMSSYYDVYQVDVYGVGSYTLTPGANQLFIPYLQPGSYSFNINVVCSGGPGSCTPRYLSGYANIYAATTTTANARP